MNTQYYKNAFKATLAIALIAPTSLYAQHVEKDPAPAVEREAYLGTAKALFDIQFQYNIGLNINHGNTLHNGVAWTGTEFWVSRWNNDTLWTLDQAGALTAEFLIAGVGQVRSITFDGTSLYMGSAGAEIFEIDPTTKTLVSTINLAGGNVGARMCAYDATADGGNGGFWIGNFTSDVQLVSMTGAILTTIPQATHGVAGIYGGAVDPYSSGGPYLWLYAQNDTTPSDNALFQISIPAGTPTGTIHDVDPDITAGPGALAGGAFIADDLEMGETSLVVVCQDGTNGSPLISYELTAGPIGIDEISQSIDVQVVPNPASTQVRINAEGMNNATVQLMDVKGAVVLSQPFSQGAGTLDVSTLEVGTYIVTISDGETTLRDRLVIKR